MADLAGRIRLVERKLAFLFENMRMKAAVSSGLTDAAGVPVPPRVFEGSLAELWAMAKELPVSRQSDEDKVDGE